MSRLPRQQQVRLRHSVDLYVTATVDVCTGRPLVELYPDNVFADGIDLTPREARTLSRALAAYADAADRKRSK